MTEIGYDNAQDAPLTVVGSVDLEAPVGAAPVDGMGCHAGAATMEAAARAAGQSELLDQYAADYPQGPHDKPQSMCPAFGSLRVGLRMRRVATVLSGSACCVYGLTFVSHFYGARRSVGYVPFSSETLVTGKLFEDIREAVFKLADPALYQDRSVDLKALNERHAVIEGELTRLLARWEELEAKKSALT